jgi:hypothetical protein
MTSRALIAAAAAVALIGLAGAASAAPGGALTGAGEALKVEAESNSLTDSVAWRRACYWTHRGQVCRWVNSRPAYYGYYYNPRPVYGFSFGYGGYRGGYGGHGGHRRHYR